MLWTSQYRSFFQQACYDTEKEILKALAIGFDLSEDYFLSLHTKPDNQLRLLHYPRYVYLNANRIVISNSQSAIIVSQLQYWKMKKLPEFQATLIFVP